MQVLQAHVPLENLEKDGMKTLSMILNSGFVCKKPKWKKLQSNFRAFKKTRYYSGYSVVYHPLLCLDYQLNAYLEWYLCSDAYFKSY